MKKLNIEKFNINNVKNDVLYIMKITEHHGDNNQQISKLFSYNTKLNEDYDYICNVRFMTIDNSLKASLKKLQQGVKEYLKENNKKLSTGNISDSDIESLVNGIGTITDSYNHETSMNLGCYIENGKYCAVYDTIMN